MATKKELKALELERTVSKAIECLKEASLSNIKDSDKIESLKKTGCRSFIYIFICYG